MVVNFYQILYQVLIIYGSIYQIYNPHHKLTEDFSYLIAKHSPLISKIISGTQASFMNKELDSLLMEKSRIRHKYTKQYSKQNFFPDKKIENKCNHLVRKSKQE